MYTSIVLFFAVIGAVTVAVPLACVIAIRLGFRERIVFHIEFD